MRKKTETFELTLQLREKDKMIGDLNCKLAELNELSSGRAKWKCTENKIPEPRHVLQPDITSQTGQFQSEKVSNPKSDRWDPCGPRKKQKVAVEMDHLPEDFVQLRKNKC